MIQYGMVALLGLLFSKSIHVFNGYTGTENLHVHDGIHSGSQWQPHVHRGRASWQWQQPIVFGSRGKSVAVDSHIVAMSERAMSCLPFVWEASVFFNPPKCTPFLQEWCFLLKGKSCLLGKL